eukprot:366558-Chlamydomonas_euryale.AAC.21
MPPYCAMTAACGLLYMFCAAICGTAEPAPAPAALPDSAAFDAPGVGDAPSPAPLPATWCCAAGATPYCPAYMALAAAAAAGCCAAGCCMLCMPANGWPM